MPRRVELPGASELFRATEAEVVPTPASPTEADETPAGHATGRVRHDEKITVYVSASELLAVEHARLRLRAAGMNVDRGRFVRAAIAAALADLEANGESADVLTRLGG